MKIGPTGGFPFGRPANPLDRGGLYVSFKILKGDCRAVLEYGTDRLCELNFGTVLSYFDDTIPECKNKIELIRRRIKKAWGDIPYNKAGLKPETGIEIQLIKSNIANQHLVRTVLPSSCPALIANPEVFLSWCEVMEDKINSTPKEDLK